MFGISPPPMLSLAPMLAYGLAVAFVAGGVALIVWGRHLHRAALVSVGIAAGLGLGWMLSDRFPVDLTTGRLISAAALGLAGLALARVVWAALAGAVFATVAGVAILQTSMHNISAEQMPVFQEGALTLGQWALSVARFFTEALSVLWSWNPALIAATVGLAAIVPLAAVLVRGRLGRILMTSVIGAAAATAGPVLAAVQVRPVVWQWTWQYWQCPAALVGLLAAAGVTIQYRAAIRADRIEAESQAELEDDDEQEQAASSGKKSKKK